MEPGGRKKMPFEELLIDADGHILEPPDLWERYLEPKYRERAVRIRVGDDGFEFLEIDRRRAQLTSSALLASLGGMKKLREMGDQVEAFNASRRDILKRNAEQRHAIFDSLSTGRPEDTYLSGCAPGAMDLKERLEILDREGIAKAVIYPTLGLLWKQKCLMRNWPRPTAAPTTDGSWISAAIQTADSCRLPMFHSLTHKRQRAN